MVITKKSPLSILIHLRVVNLACLKQRFGDCLFQVSFYMYNFFCHLQSILSILSILYILHLTIVARSTLNLKRHKKTIKYN